MTLQIFEEHNIRLGQGRVYQGGDQESQTKPTEEK